MEKQRYVITFESLHWCGGESHCVVWAENALHATYIAEDYMEEQMRELFSEEIAEEEGMDEEAQHTVTNVELLEQSEHWKFFQMPDQQQTFYPVLNGNE